MARLRSCVDVSRGLRREALLDGHIAQDRAEQLEGILHIGTAVGGLCEERASEVFTRATIREIPWETPLPPGTNS